MASDPESGYVTERIVIVRNIDNEGLRCVGASFLNDRGELIELVEGLGLLEAAKMELINRWVERADKL